MVHSAVGVAKEITLEGAQAANFLIFCISRGLFKCVQSEEEAAEVGDVLALGGVSFDMQCIYGVEFGELPDDEGCPLAELRFIGGAPPTVAATGFLALASLRTQRRGP